MRVRTLCPDEGWPEGIHTGLERIPSERLDRDWIFLVEDPTMIYGVLVTAPAHGLVLLLRVAMRSDAPRAAAGFLGRQALKMLLARGYPMWITMLDPTREEERRIYGLARRWGGVQVPTPAVVVYGLTKHKGVECLG